MTRKLVVFALTLTLALWPAGRARADAKAALSGIPADAAAFVCLPNLKVLDADIQQTINDLGLGAQVPPPMNSIVGMLKMNVPALSGLDETKPVAFVLLPISDTTQIEAKSAFLFSANDPNALLKGLGGAAGDGGVWSVNFMGQPWMAIIKGNQIIAGKDADTLKAVASSSASITSKLHKGDLEAMNNLDLMIWLDGPHFFETFKPQINGMLMMMLMRAGAQGMQPNQVEQTKKNIEEFIDGMQSFMVGLTVQQGGIGLRGSIGAKPGTTLAREMTVETTTGSLLDGLSGGPYMLAFGQVVSEAQADVMAGKVASTIAATMASGGADEAKAKKFSSSVSELLKMVRGLRLSVRGLEPGPGGLIEATKVVDVTDAPHALDLMQQLFAGAKGMVSEIAASQASAEDQDTVQKMLAGVTFEKDKEQISGAHVARLELDLKTLAKVADLDEKDVAALKTIVGDEGLMVRMAAVNKKRLVVGFGGGKAAFATAIEQAKADTAPLSADPGIKKVTEVLPKQRSMVAYIAPDQIVKTIQSVQRVLGEAPLPIQIPKLGAPGVLSSTGSDGWQRTDLFVPMDILRTMVNVSMASAAAPAPAPAQTPPGGP